MGLYAIGDLHLHFQSPLKAKAQMRERVWKDHEEKLRKNCARLLSAAVPKSDRCIVFPPYRGCGLPGRGGGGGGGGGPIGGRTGRTG